MFNVGSTLTHSFVIGLSSFLQIKRTAIKSWMGMKFGKIESGCGALATLERLENVHRLIMGKCCEHSSAFIFYWIVIILALTRATIKAWMSLKFCQIPSPPTELAAL